MENSKNFLENNVSNYEKNLNISNINNAHREQMHYGGIKNYNNALNNNRNLYSNFNNLNSNPRTISTTSNNVDRLNKSLEKSHTKNNNLANNAASKILNKMGVPKSLADKAVNSKSNNFTQNSNRKKSPLNFLGGLFGNDRNEKEEETEEDGIVNFKVPLKVKRWALISMIPIFTVIVFCCLFISASQIYLNSIKLGQADSISYDDETVNDIINKKTEEDLNNEIQDDVVALNLNESNEKRLNFMMSKLGQSNLVLATPKKKTNKYNEADLAELEDFYPTIPALIEKYDENLVYDFFFKLFNLYTTYRDTYNLEIDLPLLMSTLNLQSKDMYIVFSSNLSDEDRAKVARKKPIEDFLYEKDWRGYVSNTETSTHDMEVLVQHMFIKKVEERCVDKEGNITQRNTLYDSEIDDITLACSEGEEYEKTSPTYEEDSAKYTEFLKEFIEKKYYLDGKTPLTSIWEKTSNSGNSNNNSNNNGNNNENPSDNNTENSGDNNTETNTGNNNSNNNNNNNNNPSNGNWRTWKQCGGTWGQKIVPTSNETMCKIGCFITSVTIQIAKSGTMTLETPIDPGVAVDKFSFYSGGNFIWDSAANLAPNFRFYSSISLKGLNKENIAKKLNSYDSSKYYIVLSVSSPNSNRVGHFIALDYVDSSTNELYMIDPASNTNPKVYDVYKVYDAYIYEKRD